MEASIEELTSQINQEPRDFRRSSTKVPEEDISLENIFKSIDEHNDKPDDWDDTASQKEEIPSEPIFSLDEEEKEEPAPAEPEITLKEEPVASEPEFILEEEEEPAPVEPEITLAEEPVASEPEFILEEEEPAPAEPEITLKEEPVASEPEFILEEEEPAPAGPEITLEEEPVASEAEFTQEEKDEPAWGNLLEDELSPPGDITETTVAGITAEKRPAPIRTARLVDRLKTFQEQLESQFLSLQSFPHVGVETTDSFDEFYDTDYYRPSPKPNFPSRKQQIIDENYIDTLESFIFMADQQKRK